LFNQNQDILHEIYTIQEINDILKGEIMGILKVLLHQNKEAASESEILFIGNKKYEKFGPTPKLV
jgi:UDP-3-O-[3-hydroxymyristoyl] glucosamine N-acyltransferase